MSVSPLQDLGLAQTTATNTKTPVPLGSLAHQIYRMMCARGYAGKDFSSVFQFLREDEDKEGQEGRGNSTSPPSIASPGSIPYKTTTM